MQNQCLSEEQYNVTHMFAFAIEVKNLYRFNDIDDSSKIGGYQVLDCAF